MKGVEPSKLFRAQITPWGLITAAGGVACAATVFGFLGRFWWFLDLFSHFRVQYLIGLMILGLALLVGRRYKTAAVFIFFACLNLATVLPLYFPDQSDGVAPSETLRTMQLNANLGADNTEQVIDTVQKFDPDILLLEEISSRSLNDMQSLTDRYEHTCVQPRTDNFGIGLFSKLPLAEKKIVEIGNAAVPSVLATVETAQGKLDIIGTHTLPPGGARYSRLRNQHLEQLPEYTSSPRPTILLGDLNVTPWSHHFQTLLQESGLKNSMRGHGIQPTWPAHIPFLWIPIDHCLHSSDITIVNRTIGPNIGSDHYPIIVDFRQGE